jgi:GTP cyclohydrolase IA
MSKPTVEEAKAAVETLLSFWGEVPSREGLLGTPDRVVRAIAEFSAGYEQDPSEILSTTFSETDEYDQMIVVRGINFMSHCEHHMVPFVGTCDIVYLPRLVVVGLSKLGRLVDVYAKRLQIQERMTVQIGTAVMDHINPRGVLVRVRASHMCMNHRGVRKEGSSMITQFLGGEFKKDRNQRAEAMDLLR